MKAQIFSEAPVTISEKGERLSNMIYLKIKSGGFVNISGESKIVTAQSISNKFSNIRKTISDFCRSNQLELSNIKIGKAIPTATGLSFLVKGEISHDKVTRFLSSENFTSSGLLGIFEH
jgi:hypothetical protein